MKRKDLDLWICLAGLGLLAVLSLYFWKERTFILDAGFQAFNLIADQGYAIQVKRYGAVMVQTIPVLLTKAGFSIDTILVGYSLSFTLYPLILFLTLWWLRSYKFAKVLAVYYLLVMAYTFFWVQSEAIQATALTIFALGIYRSPRLPNVAKYTITLGLVLLTLYTHPLSVISLLYGFTYVFIDEFTRADRRRWHNSFLLLPAIVGVFVLKQFYLGTGSYDENAMGMFGGFSKFFPNFFSLQAWLNFKQQVLTTYQALPVFFLAALFFLGKERKFLKAASLLIGVAGWLAIVLTTFQYGAEQFYIEAYYLMLGFFLALPIVLDVFPAISARKAEFVLTGLIVYRVVMIGIVSEKYTDRFDYLDRLTDRLMEQQDQRYLIREERIDGAKLEQLWPLPYETALLSAAKDRTRPRTVLTFTDAPPEWVKDWYKNAIPTPWGPHTYGRFQSNRHFNFTDTTEIRVLDLDIR